MIVSSTVLSLFALESFLLLSLSFLSLLSEKLVISLYSLISKLLAALNCLIKRISLKNIIKLTNKSIDNTTMPIYIQKK